MLKKILIKIVNAYLLKNISLIVVSDDNGNTYVDWAANKIEITLTSDNSQLNIIKK